MLNTFDTLKEVFPTESYDFYEFPSNWQYFAKTHIWFKSDVTDTEFVRKRFKFDPDDPELGEWVVNKPKELADQVTLRLVWDYNEANKQGSWTIEVAGPISYLDLSKLLEPIEEYKEFFN